MAQITLFTRPAAGLRCGCCVVSAAATLLLASCGEPAGRSDPSAGAQNGQAEATAAAASTADMHRFDAGGVDATVVRDGRQSMANDGAMLGSGQTPAALAAVMRDAGLPEDRLELDFNALLLRIGDRVVLVDTGFGGGAPFAGRLVRNLAAAGVRPEQVTDVVITHAHPDHIGGVVDGDGRLTYPNAQVHMSDAEWRYLGTLAEGNSVEARAAIEPKLVRAAFDRPIAPGVLPVAAPGHTPGQMALRIGEGPTAVLFISDAAHHYAMSLARPDWPAGSDADGAAAVRTRRMLFERAVAENTRVHGYHFPFPGLGRVSAAADGTFRWTAEPTR